MKHAHRQRHTYPNLRDNVQAIDNTDNGETHVGFLLPPWSRVVHAPAVLAAVTAICSVAAGVAQAQVPPRAAGSFVANEIIVRLSADAAADSLSTVLIKVGGVGARRFEIVAGLYAVTIREGLDVATAVDLARQVPGVMYAEPNYVVSTVVTPNDTRFGDLWGLHNTGASGGTPGADIHAPEAWDLTTGSRDVVVAVIDTGIDYNHVDLAANIFRNEQDCNGNGLDDDGNGFIDDCHGIDTVNHDADPLDDNNHGTHTAGTIGAVGNNANGVVGVNWNVRILACKFLNAAGSGSTADAIACLDYVALMKDRGVNIVATNNSWAGAAFSQALFDAIDAQRQRGILFVAAAGNAGSDNDSTPSYPASIDLPNVIAVASTTRTDALSSFSNRGRRTVLIGAPGSEILSTTINNTFSTLSGTSMATPHVTGVAALLKAQDPSRDWRALRNLIVAGGDLDPNLSSATVTGRRLNAFGSLTCANSLVFSRLKPVQTSISAPVGVPITLSALNVNCALPNGSVSVRVDPGARIVTLSDDGVAPDVANGDGIYSASFASDAAGRLTFTFPNGDVVAMDALASTPYTVQPTEFSFREIAGTNLNMDDDSSTQINLPFPITFAGASFSSLFANSNGNVTLTGPFTAFGNETMPTTALDAPIIAPFWDDLILTPGSNQNVFWQSIGAAPHRQLVVEWRDVPVFLCGSSETVTFELIFFEGSNAIVFSYADVNFGGSCTEHDRGRSATIGVQTSAAIGTQFSFNTQSISDSASLLWVLTAPPPFTDEQLVPRTTLIKALHITELRSRIDALRGRLNLAPMHWTDPTIVGGVTTPKAVHVLEMRDALNQILSAAGMVPPSFTDATIEPRRSVIRSIDIDELRILVKMLEATL